MNVYDCFMYFDEDLLLDLRLNILNKYVDKFVITAPFVVFVFIFFKNIFPRTLKFLQIISLLFTINELLHGIIIAINSNLIIVLILIIIL